ncbi:MAG: helix-turn-helix transcriptional regulator [Bacteroidales bacterium]|nr:helix-turn-helix transcriptional regulator [Bacteroidales bacterium]
MNFRSNIKSLCKLQGITQKELADKIGITNSALNISLSKNNPRFSTLESIAEALGVSVSLLTSEDMEKALVDQAKQEQEPQEPRQGIYCPHCGRPLTLFVKAENVAEEQ